MKKPVPSEPLPCGCWPKCHCPGPIDKANATIKGEHREDVHSNLKPDQVGELVERLSAWSGSPFDDDAHEAAALISAQQAEIEQLKAIIKYARAPSKAVTPYIVALKEAQATIATLTAERDALKAQVDRFADGQIYEQDRVRKHQATIKRLEGELAQFEDAHATLTAERDHFRELYGDRVDRVAALTAERDAALLEENGLVLKQQARIKELEEALLRCDGINDNPACFNPDLDKHLEPFIKDIKARAALGGRDKE